MRCLIEHIVAEPLKGERKLDTVALDNCVAYMIHIINWGLVSDSLNFAISDISISLLESGRICTDKSFHENVLYRYMQCKNDEIIFYGEKYLSKTFSLPNSRAETEAKSEENDLERAFNFEFKLKYQDYVDITFLAIYLALDNNNSICIIKEIDFITHIEERGFKKEIILTYLYNFSLFNRGKVQNVREHGFKNEDFYPWRYNRKLSLLRRPFVLVKKEGEKYLYFGARSLYDFMLNLVSVIEQGRLQSSSVEMKSYLAKINNQNGKSFNDEVYSFLHKSFIDKDIHIRREVGIKPRGALTYIDDIGDIDILIINNESKRIICVECKYLIESRTPYEMYLELLKFTDGSDPWIPKVNRRNEWIHNNKNAFSSLEITCDIEQYSFEYIFLTNESISTPFIRENEIQYRFLTFIEIQNNLGLL